MIIDLSLPLHPSLPVYPGDDTTQFVQRQTFDHDGYTAHRVIMSCHAGTHVDAPLHAVPCGASIEQSSILNACVGDAFLIPVDTDEGIDIHPSHLATQTHVQQGNRIILRTGWSEQYGKNGYYYNHPSFTHELADFCIDRKVILVGIDTPSVHFEDKLCHDIHHKLLDAGIIIIENLANLNRIPAEQFFFSAAPLSFEGLDGSPTRAYAIVPE